MSSADSELPNDASELVGYNLFESHAALAEALAREGDPADLGPLTALGARLGSAEMFALGATANRNPPVDVDALMARAFL